MPQYNARVEKRRHPFGEQGVNHSLDQVAKKAAEGSSDWRVRRYVGEVLKNAGIRKATNDRQTAAVLLKAVQQKTWMQDPVGTEWMPGAHLMTCVDKDTPCFHAGDCDDLVILLAACFLSSGLYTIIVGHAYNKKRQIQHVLAAVRVDGKWLYADPSTDLPLGKSVEFTRERWLSVPNIKVICDQNKCSTDLRGFDPLKNDFVVEGNFVGVDGVPPMGGVVWEDQVSIQWLGATSDDVASSAETAASEEMAERDYGTSRDDVKAYASAAGEAGAVAVCTAYGAGAAAQTICGPIGAAIGEYLGGALYDAAEEIFSPGPSEEELKKAAEAQRAKEELQWIVGNLNPEGNLELAFSALTDLYRKANERIGMGGWPPTETALARALQAYGLPISWTTGGPTAPNFPNSELSASQMSPHHAVAYLEDAVPWMEKLRLSVTQLSNRIIGQAGASAALVAEGKEPQPISLPASPSEIKVSPIVSRMKIQPKTTEKKSLVVPVVGTAVAGGIAWWLWSVFA